MEVIAAARDLHLQDWAIGAGFVRNLVWDHLHGRPDPTPLNDIDVLFFDPDDPSRGREDRLQTRLSDAMPGVPWSVRNQARMHVGNGDPPYRSTLHAMSCWLETATAVGVRQSAEGELDLLAPFGTADLFALRVVPTAAGLRKRQTYLSRVRSKGWLETWPRLELVVTNDGAASLRK
ncbi:MAG: nucleotidyltransferase family protein [Minwuia sp.]|nr:nucleotidyltransferase family protein [Minwuia sp.]